MSETAPLPEHAATDPLAEAYRKERRAFWWTCGWMVGVALAWGGGVAVNIQTEKELAKSRASGGNELVVFLDKSLPWVVALLALLAIFLIAFLVCLVGWLLAIRRRRRVEAEAFSR